MDRSLWGNPLWQWITAAGLVVAIVILFIALRTVLVSRLGRLAQRTVGKVDDLIVALIGDLRTPPMSLVALWIGSSAVALPASVAVPLRVAAVIACAVQVVLSSRLAIEFGLRAATDHWKAPDGQPDPMIQSGLGILRFMAMLIVAILVALATLDNLGIAVTPMIAGLGIGGLAIALAVQNILGDLFASMSILFDKPFMVGDYIVVGDKQGTVENIGVKTTRVRALSGEQLVFTNSDLLTSRIQNFKRMTERRSTFGFGVVYGLTTDQLRRIPRIVQDAVERQPQTRFERCNFKSFGAYSLDFDCVYYMTVPDAALQVQAQEAINLEIYERFGAEKIEFAFPTQVTIGRA